MRGEFIRGDGLVVPNNITRVGAQRLLQGAFQKSPTALRLYMGLVEGTPTPTLQAEQLYEPTLGVGGYARVTVSAALATWPTIALLNNEYYAESIDCVFAATGPYSVPIQRLALYFSDVALTGDVFALSAALPAPLLIDSATAANLRTFRYRVYLR